MCRWRHSAAFCGTNWQRSASTARFATQARRLGVVICSRIKDDEPSPAPSHDQRRLRVTRVLLGGGWGQAVTAAGAATERQLAEIAATLARWAAESRLRARRAAVVTAVAREAQQYKGLIFLVAVNIVLTALLGASVALLFTERSAEEAKTIEIVTPVPLARVSPAASEAGVAVDRARTLGSQPRQPTTGANATIGGARRHSAARHAGAVAPVRHSAPNSSTEEEDEGDEGSSD